MKDDWTKERSLARSSNWLIRSDVAIGLVAGASFLGLLLFAVLPQPGDTTLMVVFMPGTSEGRMAEAVTQAGARLLAFSRLSFAVLVHVEAGQTTARLQAAALFVTHPFGIGGCRGKSKISAGAAS